MVKILARCGGSDRACAGSYHELSAMCDRFKWARLLDFVTGLVNQEFLQRNEFLAAENRILRARVRASMNSPRTPRHGILRYQTSVPDFAMEPRMATPSLSIRSEFCEPQAMCSTRPPECPRIEQ